MEHVVLENIVRGVSPVVGDVARVLVTHDVCLDGVGAVGVDGGDAASFSLFRLSDEAIHLSAIDVGGRTGAAVGPAPVLVRGVVVGTDAATVVRVRHAHRELASLPGQPIGAGVEAEVVIEAAVLLHDHDHVLDLVDPDLWWSRRRIRGLGWSATRHAGEHDRDSKCPAPHAA